MDIKEKLRLLEALPRNKRQNHADLQRDEPSDASDFQAATSKQTFSVFEKTYPLEYAFQELTIGDYIAADSDFLNLASSSSDFSKADLARTLFIDTETTGLSGGAGTCAFLIGAGFFNEQGFCLRQYLMNDFDQEPALYDALNALIEDFQLVVSYNGKSFDIPLLNSRNVYLGTPGSPFQHLPHFDLLHAVRRLWGHRIPDCSLDTAEAHLLGVQRSSDIPGYLIPYRFFDYLRTRNLASLQPVLRHNQQDIVSMVGLCVRILRRLQHPLDECESWQDILRVGRLYEKMQRYEHAEACYRRFLDAGEPRAGSQEILMRLAFMLKKQGKWSAAEQTWQACLEQQFHPLPYIELAKHYEHRTKDPAAALRLVDRGLQGLAIMDSLGRTKWQEYYEDLKYRRSRLVRKNGR